MSLCYVPGSHAEAERILRECAKANGYEIAFTSRGDLRVFRCGRLWGHIFLAQSIENARSPSPVASRGFHHFDLEPLRSAMNDALVAAGILHYDTKEVA